MEDTEYIGGSGIDTKLERDQINYAPNIEPTDKKTTGSTNTIADVDVDTDTGFELDMSNPAPVSDVYVRIGETYNYVTTLVNALKTELKDTPIPVSSTYIQAIKASPVVIDDMSGITTSGIPFDVYDAAIEDPENPTYALIQEAVEAYAEDINGNIKLELYPDVKEMQLNLEEMHDLLTGTLYSQFVDTAQIPAKPKIDDTFYKDLKEQEGKQTEAYDALTRLHALNETVYYGLLTNSYGSDEYYDALEAHQQSKKEKDDFTRVLNQQKEFTSFATIDTSMTQKTATKINRHINSDSEVDETEVKTLLGKQYSDNAEYTKTCKQMQAITKLQINKQIEVKKQQKDILKTTGGLALKKRVHDEVTNLTNIRNDVYLNLYKMMNNMVDPTRSSGVESLLDQVAQGMGIVKENYKAYLQEMYQAHMLDQEVRSAKVGLTADKQVARDSYWLLDNLVK